MAPRVFPRNKPSVASRPAQASGHSDIAAVLGSQILSGARKPGSRMPSVEEMLQSFGVSRVVMREVSKTLAAKGMVTSKTRVGTLVTESSSWNWLDPEVLGWRIKLGMDHAFLTQVTDIRLAVEPAAAAAAARNRTRDDIARMRAALVAMRKSEGSRHDYTQADIRLHLMVGQASGNPMFGSFAGVIAAALSGLNSIVSFDVIADHKSHAQTTAQHAAIVDAIEARDPEAAENAMRRVINKGVRHVLKKRDQ